MLRVFNNTDKPVDTVITVQAIGYELHRVGEQVVGWKPKSGDHYFRLATVKERDEIAEFKLGLLRRKYRTEGRRMAPTHQVRADLRRFYSNTLLVVLHK